MKRILTISILLIAVIAGGVYMLGGHAYAAVMVNYSAGLLPNLSDYRIFQGDPVKLIPGNGFYMYELATGLFTDYAEKQRLIKLPEGAKVTAVDDGILQFPNGTILVKTFYYFNDKRDESKGKRLIETRLLIKNNGQWHAGTYVWNKEQTEARLVTGGVNTPVTWLDDNARHRTISYRIPSTKDCATCHNTGNSIIPLGPKVRNMNIDVLRNNNSINQLKYLQNAGIMHPADPSRFGKLPAWQNSSYSIEDRARAWLEVNCAHCHSENGSCARSPLRFSWEIPFNDTRIAAKKNRIVSMISKGRMPRIGTTMVDEEALALIKSWLP
jgi:uncharacterized repeat protein (TIGR03806 family)